MKRFVSLLLLIVILSLSVSSYAESYLMYTIKPGDSYWTISNKYNVDISKLQTLNKEIGEVLYIGNLLKISYLKDNKTIKVNVDGSTIDPDIDPYVENSRTFVPIRFIAEALNVDEIIWDGKNNKAILKDNGRTIELPIDSSYAYVDNNPIKLDAPINVYKGRTFVPVRFIAETLNCTVTWDSNTYTVDISNNNSVDLLWLARIVEAEAKGEPYEGKLAVANVILNRKDDNSFPNSIKEVIFDTKYGVQFTPVINGDIYNNPSNESIKAAQSALTGENNIGDCLYFLNPIKADSSWIVNNRSFYTKISNHSFYK